MANKLILLPIEHYRGLIAAREKIDDDVTEQTNFGFVKQQFEKAKRKRAANVSEKSAEYNQQLRRYLKLRKEVKDKPVKVQLSNGMRLMTKPPATGVQLKPGPEEVEETIVIGGSEADDDETATISTPKFSTPKEVEVGPEPRPSRKRDLKKQEIMAKEQQLLSIIKSDPKRFGVNARDKIINPSTGREFIDFDLTRAIERLVNPRPENAPSPSDVQADLADFQALSRKNSGNRYLLLAIDVLSRRMFGAPVKSKKPADMKRAFVELFGQMPKLPETLYTDRGLEFVAKPLKEFYAEKGIKKFETSSKKKAAVAERAIRYMPNYSDHVYTVDERRSSNPEHYFLKDYYGTKLKRKFYLPELTKVKVDKNTLYRVEKKYKERMRDGQKEMLVKFIGFPEKYWVTNEDFVEQ
uniref:Integrase catalytic domain-containing protein n=1 Tax=Globodera rostochiensis TaxID=31243 RepID=A0A914HAK1_GLORO